MTGAFPKSMTGRACALCAPSVDFASDLCAVLNDSYSLHSPFLPWARPDNTVQQVRESLRIASQKFDDEKEEIRYYIFDNHTKSLAGCIGLFPVDISVPSFELGYWTSINHLGKGLVSESVRLLCEWLIVNRSARRLEITTSSLNYASHRVAIASGFKLEAKLSNHRRSVSFGLHDTFIFSRLTD